MSTNRKELHSTHKLSSFSLHFHRCTVPIGEELCF